MSIEIVAYPGEAGAYSEEGALALFPDAEHRPLPSIRMVFESVGEYAFYADVEAPAELPVMVDARRPQPARNLHALARQLRGRRAQVASSRWSSTGTRSCC
jgi:hypothetical protein